MSGGTSVTVTGTNLEDATAVDFGPDNRGSITADSATSVTATSPAGTGTVDVTVTTPERHHPTGAGRPVLLRRPAVDQALHLDRHPGLRHPVDHHGAAMASQATVAANGGPGGGGGGAASSDSGDPAGPPPRSRAPFAVTGGQQLTGVTGCAGATAPNGSGVVSTGGAGGVGYSNGGGGGNGYYCAGIDVEGVCIGDGGADGSGGGGGGSSAVCVGTSCQVGVTPLVVAAGGGGGGESMCAGSDGGGGGTGGGGSSTSSVDLTGAGPSGTNGGMGATSGDVGGAGGVNNTGDSPGGTAGGPGSDTVSAGDSAGNGGGGGGYVGRHRQHGHGRRRLRRRRRRRRRLLVGGQRFGATFGTTSAAGAVTAHLLRVRGYGPAVTTQPAGDHGQRRPAGHLHRRGHPAIPSPDVQWQVSTDGGHTFTNINGATSADTDSFTTTAADNGNEYQAVFTNSVGHGDHHPATLTVDTPPTVTTQPTMRPWSPGSRPPSPPRPPAIRPRPSSGRSPPTAGPPSPPSAVPPATPTRFTTAAGENGNEYQAVFTNSVGSVRHHGGHPDPRHSRRW